MDIEKFRRHIGKGKNIKIGEDEFYFKPLTVRQLPDLLEIVGIMNKGQDKIFEKENSTKLFNLLQTFVKNSYPDLSDEDLNGFISSNIIPLQNALVEVNASTFGVNEEQRNAIESFKAKHNEVQSASKE